MALLFSDSFGRYADGSDFNYFYGSGNQTGVWTFPAGGRYDPSAPVIQGGPDDTAAFTGFPSTPENSFFFFHCAIKPAITSDGATLFEMFSFREMPADQTHLQIARIGPDTIRITSGGTVLEQAIIPGVLSNNAWHWVEAKLRIDDTTGAWTVKVDGVQVLDGTGDTRLGGVTGEFNEFQLQTPNTANTSQFDDLVLWNDTAAALDDFAGELRLEKLLPDAVGASTQWTPIGLANNWQNVAKATISQVLSGQFNQENTNGQKDTHNIENGAIAGVPLAVRVMVGGRRTAATVRVMQSVLRSGGGTEVDGPLFAYGLGVEFHAQTADTEPGGALWDNTKIDAMQGGYKLA